MFELDHQLQKTSEKVTIIYELLDNTNQQQYLSVIHEWGGKHDARVLAAGASRAHCAPSREVQKGYAAVM